MKPWNWKGRRPRGGVSERRQGAAGRRCLLLLPTAGCRFLQRTRARAAASSLFLPFLLSEFFFSVLMLRFQTDMHTHARNARSLTFCGRYASLVFKLEVECGRGSLILLDTDALSCHCEALVPNSYYYFACLVASVRKEYSQDAEERSMLAKVEGQACICRLDDVMTKSLPNGSHKF